MQPRPPLRRSDLIEPDLSYDIVGAVLDVFRELGPGLRESAYQKGVALALQQRNLPFREQVYCQLLFRGKRVGYIYLDFCVKGKVILELKRGEYFARAYIAQVSEYLATTGLPLAIIAQMSYHGVKFRRIINVKLVPKSLRRS